MLRHTLPADRLSDNVDLDAIAQQAEGYSGSDLVLVCKEAAMRPLRKLLSRLDAAPGGGGYRDGALPQPDRVREEDLRAALACTRPTVSQFGARYKEWEAEFGSV
jgi:katanin p60 ATPase-containing subunit A1